MSWHKFTISAERLLNSDDNRGAVRARTELDRLLLDPPLPASSMDPALFAFFLDALKAWTQRLDPVERERIGGVARVMAATLRELPLEAARLADERAAQGGARYAAGVDG